MGSKLIDYIETHRDVPFDWSTNNCVSFVAGFVGDRVPARWSHGYASATEARHAYRQMLSEFGHDSILDALDARFERELTLFPSDGMICARRENGPLRYALGLTLRGHCVFLTDVGARALPVELGDIFWSIR